MARTDSVNDRPDGEHTAGAESATFPIAHRRVQPTDFADQESTLGAATYLALPAAVLVADEKRIVRSANHRASVVLGRARNELVGTPLGHLLTLGKTHPIPLDVDQRHECEAQLGDGSRIRIGYSCSGVSLEGGGNYVALVFQDTSHLAALEAERDRLLRIATIGQALPSLLHELKNPLAAIAAATEVLLEESESEDVREQLHAILSEIRRMKLSFDGIGALERPLRTERNQAVDYACREAAAVMAYRAKNAGQLLRVFVKDMPLLPFDPGVVRALVLNFATNAIQACRAGDTITFSTFYDNATDSLEMRVVDTGEGMAPQTLERVTELFCSTKASGSGIGLSLCKRAIEGAHGTLTIRSVPGFGTAVEVSIPRDGESQIPREGDTQHV